MDLLPPRPEPVFVVSGDRLKLASYDHGGDPDAPVVLAVHGFASNAYSNWVVTGWVRELQRAGYRVISFDQRGHGSSDKPHDPRSYSMPLLVADALSVIDTYLLDEVIWVGYSLGARVGWHAALELPHLVSAGVLGGIPDGDPLTRFDVAQAKDNIENGAEVTDRLTAGYLTMASGFKGNDLRALVALVEGMRGGPQPDRANPPAQPLLFATGSKDRILDASRELAEATPRGEFFEIPGRNHFNAPTASAFRSNALEFLGRLPR
ncbi:alpha/beta fold hydrolase [Herbiconiux sp. L3-i23]|uniref:alpha/beta fold hydrolase n=1 Tax=Herbiconiux sp. L3-i23 TaxID=2905871 RepID=UPI0020496149|nr:alpha/beta hydrolase [Herbiconiux sp. L3-i23]BDI23627.1 hydrolase [Herbiconiux sp. L3-i23]